MHFAFTPEQQELREAVQQTLREECTPSVLRAAWSEHQTQLWGLLAELGVLGINAPESIGGMGMSAADWVLLLEEAGQVALPGPLIETIAAVPFLVEAGEQQLAERVISGEAMVSIAPEQGYALDADRAEVVLQISQGQVRALREPTLTPQASMDGARRLFTVEGEGPVLAGDLAALENRATLAASAQLLGLGRQVLDSAVAYAKERKQFGKPIGSFQAVQHHLVDALLKLSFASPMVYRAAWSLSEGDAARSTHVSMAKIYASEAAYLASRKSLQVHGAIGYTEELDLHLWMKRIWALTSSWGSPAEHRDRVATTILGESDA
jgi:alkylation response protein AidB-like acyl-CoA dehydrogenase